MKFRILLVIYLLLLVIALVLLSGTAMWILSVASSLFFIVVMSYGVTTIKSNFFLHSVAHPPDGTVVLSFDDGPDPNCTPKVLEILDKYQVKAIFFLIGKEVTKYPALVAKIHAEGHLIGNHSDAHDLTFTFKSASQVEQDLIQANEKISKITGSSIQYVRPPFGITNPSIAKAIQRLRMISVGWNFRPKDTNFKDPEKLLQVLKSKTKPSGTLVLLHDRIPATVDVLEEYILFCKEKGMKFGTLKAQ